MGNFNMNNIEGIDVDIETSLCEYGIAWILSNDKKEYMFFYGIKNDGQEHIEFDNCSFNCDIDIYSEFDWACFNDIYETMGMTKKDWDNMPFPQKINDICGYYGYENVFGSSYGGSAYNANINRFQAIKEK